MESLILVELFGLWIASGFGYFIRRPYFERIHYDIVALYLDVFFREAKRVARLSIVTEGSTPDAFPGEPLLVCCRHAGPADSFTLMYALMHWYGREPRVVLKDTLAWDPVIDVILHRLPSRFISPHAPGGRGTDLETQVGELASNLDHNDAFVIFPEGGNFTPERRQRAIDKLRKLGLRRWPGAPSGCRTCWHPGPVGYWQRSTRRRRRTSSSWRTPDSTICHRGGHLARAADGQADHHALVAGAARGDPPDREDRIDWLFSWWERIDAWVEEHRPMDLPPRERRRQARAESTAQGR
jgi:1-acyl-sn-glycerol-3-phosphate acyltransferase